MARSPSDQPTQRELEILAVLWEHGPASLGTVCDALRRQRPLATTTVATMLKVMLDKKLVTRRRALWRLSMVGPGQPRRHRYGDGRPTGRSRV